MSERNKLLQGLRQAAERRAKADRARRKATDELRGWCQRAQRAGIPITEIAEAAGLSRQGVYDLLDR